MLQNYIWFDAPQRGSPKKDPDLLGFFPYLFQHPLQIQFGHLNQTIALNFTQKILALTNSALQKRYKMLTDLFFFVSDSPELAKHGGFQAW